MELQYFTVLVQRPDYVAFNYGLDTYLAHVQAHTPREAQTIAQNNVATIDRIEGGSDVDDPIKEEDYAVLLVVRGKHNDLKGE